MIIRYHTAFNAIPLFEISDVSIAKLRAAAFIPDDETEDVAEEEIHKQFMDYLRKMSDKPLDLYEDVLELITQIEECEQMPIGAYFEECIKKLSSIRWEYSFKYVPQLEDLINDDWTKKLRTKEDDDEDRKDGKMDMTALFESDHFPEGS